MLQMAQALAHHLNDCKTRYISVFAVISIVACVELLQARPTMDTYDGKPKAGTADTRPAEIEGVGITQKLGQKIDGQLQFADETGKAVKLADYFDGKTPVIISPIYFNCPGLCNFHLNGLTEGLKMMDWNVGDKFKVLAISFDWNEKPEVAKPKKDNYMSVYDRPGTEGGWHFLTGDQANVSALMETIGFKYKWNEQVKEWAHGSAAIVVSPKGEITRYLPGIQFEGKDIKLALNESARGKIGGLVDGLVLYCFSYDNHANKYTLAVFKVLQLAGFITVLLLGLWLAPTLWRSRKKAA